MSGYLFIGTDASVRNVNGFLIQFVILVKYFYFEHFAVAVSLPINARTFLCICIRSNSYALI